MFLKAIKNFCSLSLQLTSFNQDSLCLKMKIFSVCLCLLCTSVDSQMRICASRGICGTVCLFKDAAVCHSHDSHPQQRSIFSKRSTELTLRKPNLDYKMLADKSNVLLKNIH